MKSTLFNTVRACGATTLALALAACGGSGDGNGNGGTVTPPPPVVAQSITLSGDATQVLPAGKPVALTATLATPATVTWAISEGPGTLSATTGANVTYTPPTAGVATATQVVIKASAGDASKTYRVTVYPEPGTPGLSLVAGLLNGTSAADVDGTGAQARFHQAVNLYKDAAGNIFVLEDPDERVTNNNANGVAVRKITPAGQVSTLVRGQAPHLHNGLTRPRSVIADANGTVYFSMIQENAPLDHRSICGAAIYKLGANGAMTQFAGSGQESGYNQPTQPDGTGTAAGFCDASLAGFDGDGNLYAVDTVRIPDTSQNKATYRKITPQGVVTTISALPDGITIGAPDGFQYVSLDHAIYRKAADGSQTLVAGVPGVNVNRPGPLPGSLDSPVTITPTGPASFIVIANSAILKLVLPH